MDNYGIPAVEHVDTLFTALMDTVAGNEGLSLTAAQEYAFSVLSVEDLNSRERVTGCEGFFSGIASSVKKIWEYIQKLFKSVWDFFFGKDKGAKEKIADAEKKVEEHATVLGDNLSEAKLDWIQGHQSGIRAAFQRFSSSVENLDEVTKRSDGTENPAGALVKRMKTEFEASLRTSQPVMEAVVKKVTTAAQAREVHSKLTVYLNCLKADEEIVARYKSGYEKLIEDLDHKLQGNKDELDKMVLEFELKVVQGGLNMFATLSKYLTRSTEAVVSLSKLIASATQ